MHILVVFTGGTIGSSILNGCIAPDEQKGYRLLELYKGLSDASKLPKPCDFTVVEPFQTLSENMTCDVVAKLIREIRLQLSQKEYDGVIVCHGTDTLQYTAAMTAYCFAKDCVPIVFVSSNYVLEDKRANGLANFAAAVSFISHEAGRGVFIAYQNTGDYVRIHRATRVLPHLPYSDDVISLMRQPYGYFEGDILNIHTYKDNPQYVENEDEMPVFSVDNIDEWGSAILEIYPATGMEYPDLTAYPDMVKAILHHTYHSGTICAKTPGLVQFAKQAYEQGIPIYLTGVEDGKFYESMKEFHELGIKVLPKASPIAMYVKLFLCAMTDLDPDDMMYRSLNGDLM